MYCPNCGFKNEEGSVYCANCGTNMKVRTTIVYPNEETVNNEKYNPWAIAGFILSLVNILIGATFIPGVLGLIFSAMGNSQIANNGGKGRGLAIAGLVISIISLAGYFLLFALVFGLAACASCFVLV